MRLAITFTLIVLVIVGLASADVPNVINYQGYLTDSGGDPVDGPVLINFKIYGSETGDDSLWWSGHRTIQVDNGFFNYQLGSNSPLPSDFFGSGSDPFLGIIVSTDPEITPRTAITSSAFAWHANSSDTADFANTAAISQDISCSHCVSTAQIDDGCINADKIAPSAVTSDKIQNGTIQFVDIGSNGAGEGEVMKRIEGSWRAAPDETGSGGGDITAVIAGDGLAGGAHSGDATLAVDTEGINSSHIATNAVGSEEIDDLSIGNADISNSANISTTKISGTAVNLNSLQIITGEKHFDGEVYFGDSTLHVNNTGIRIGDHASPYPTHLVGVERTYNTSDDSYGIDIDVENSGTGNLYGVYCGLDHTTASSGGDIYGFYGLVRSDGTSRIALYGEARATTPGLVGGSTYGARFQAYDGSVTYGVYAYAQPVVGGMYGLYASVGISDASYGVYCVGDLHATGTNTKGSGGYTIDHPNDPENMFLNHSDVSSPDMMNIYNGNVTTDGNGDAVVALPEYFESLNADFRYQLTVVGAFAQAIISEKMHGNRFSIKTDKPFIEVSWQVTGIRQDLFAKDASFEVESVKENDKQGLYMHPELYGYGMEKSLNKDNEPVTNEISD